MAMIRIMYYDGTREYLTEAQWEKKKTEDRELCRKLKASTPFVKCSQQ